MKKQTNEFCSGSLSPSKYSLRSLFKQTILAALIMLLGIGVQAQQKVHVTGTVNDDKGNPAANASVTLRGGKQVLQQMLAEHLPLTYLTQNRC